MTEQEKDLGDCEVLASVDAPESWAEKRKQAYTAEHNGEDVFEIVLRIKGTGKCPHCLGPALIDPEDVFWCVDNMERSEFPCRFKDDGEPVE